MKKKILVIGGSGFIGQRLCLKLSEKNIVTNFDIKERLIPSVKFIKGDINKKIDVENAIKNKDIVYNLAGQTELEESQKNARIVFSHNILGLINILDTCIKYKVKRLVHASTVYVYSNLGGFYSISKKCAEQIIKEYEKKFNLKNTIIRFGSIYGPGSKRGNAIFEILNMAIKKKRITYWGSGNETREYIHVDDASEGCIKALDKKFLNKKIMCSGMQNIKVSDMLIMVKEIFNNKISIKYKKNSRSQWHYKITPYQIEEDICYKLTLDKYIDFGKGLIDLVNSIKLK